MPAPHTVDTSNWEPWQRDYVFGVILVMPPPHVASSIDALRQAYDPKSHAICSAHISVSAPLRRELSDRDRGEIQGLLRAVEPFEVHFDGPTASLHHPGVTCPVAPQERFDELKYVIHQSSVFKGAVSERREIPAHMTIAEFVTIAESLKIVGELANKASSGSFWCDRLEYVAPDSTFRLKHYGTFFLGAHR